MLGNCYFKFTFKPREATFVILHGSKKIITLNLLKDELPKTVTLNTEPSG